MSIQTFTEVEIDPVTGSPRCAHIVKQKPGKTAHAIVMEARIMGIEVEALCGHRWVPERDPGHYPVCPQCEEVYHSKVDPEKGLPEA